MKKMSCLLSFAIVCFMFLAIAVTPALSQEDPADNMQLLREHLRTGKKLIIADAMKLTESEAEAFWPVYNDYQKGLIDLGDRTLKQIENYAKNYETMSEETAQKMVDDYIDMECDRVTLMQVFLPKFRSVLSEKKVARYFQVENKIKALVKYELAANIPLVK
jgi:hypothetical protein